jgi:hypothetical protein
MDNSVQQLRNLLRLAATLRSFAAEASAAGYADKLLGAAVELETRADILAGHRAGPPSGNEHDAPLHARVDIRV